MSVDTYAPSSALSFLDMDDNELLRGADTQPTQYDYRDFTMPSTSQSQTQGDQLDLQVSSQATCVCMSVCARVCMCECEYIYK